jgi:hypothetical protein
MVEKLKRILAPQQQIYKKKSTSVGREKPGWIVPRYSR